MWHKDLAAIVVQLVASVGVVLLVISIGWAIVWTAFLKKFPIMQEIFGKSAEDSEAEAVKVAREKIKRYAMLAQRDKREL